MITNFFEICMERLGGWMFNAINKIISAEWMQNLVVILGNLAMVFSAIFVAVQVNIFKRDYNFNDDKASREKAIELSKFYSDNILLNKITYIKSVFSRCGIQKIIECVKFSDLKEFDNQELEEVLGNEKTLIIKKIMENIGSVEIGILINASKYINFVSINDYLDNLDAINFEKYHKATAESEAAATIGEDLSKEEQEKIKKQKSIMSNRKLNYHYYRSKYSREFNHTVAESLNLLEYFCMNFNSGIADEETVYQSLHQTFLGTVKLLYYNISERNVSGKDKYYTNIIKLYNKWSDRYEEQHQKERESSRCGTYEKEPMRR